MDEYLRRPTHDETATHDYTLPVADLHLKGCSTQWWPMRRSDLSTDDGLRSQACDRLRRGAYQGRSWLPLRRSKSVALNEIRLTSPWDVALWLHHRIATAPKSRSAARALAYHRGQPDRRRAQLNRRIHHRPAVYRPPLCSARSAGDRAITARYGHRSMLSVPAPVMVSLLRGRHTHDDVAVVREGEAICPGRCLIRLRGPICSAAGQVRAGGHRAQLGTGSELVGGAADDAQGAVGGSAGEPDHPDRSAGGDGAGADQPGGDLSRYAGEPGSLSAAHRPLRGHAGAHRQADADRRRRSEAGR